MTVSKPMCDRIKKGTQRERAASSRLKQNHLNKIELFTKTHTVAARKKGQNRSKATRQLELWEAPSHPHYGSAFDRPADPPGLRSATEMPRLEIGAH